MINPRKYLRYPGFKTKAVLLSFDDGQIYDRKFIEILCEYNMKGSFNLCSSGVNSDAENFIHAEEGKKLYLGNGMEIAVHGEYHGFWLCQNFADAVQDCLNCKIQLEKAFGIIVRGLAYPSNVYLSFDEKISQMVNDLGFAYARGVDANKELGYNIPICNLNWANLPRTTGIRNPELLDIAKKYIEMNPRKEFDHYSKMFLLCGHSFDIGVPDKWDILDNFCKTVANKEDVWYPTVLEYADYVKAYQRLYFSAENQYVYNPTDKDIYLEIGLTPIIVKAGSTMELKK